MVSVQQEQDIESLLKDGVWNIVLFTHVIHLVQEARNEGGEKLSLNAEWVCLRAGIAQICWRRYEFSALADPVCHSIVWM